MILRIGKGRGDGWMGGWGDVGNGVVWRGGDGGMDVVVVLVDMIDICAYI